LLTPAADRALADAHTPGYLAGGHHVMLSIFFIASENVAQPNTSIKLIRPLTDIITRAAAQNPSRFSAMMGNLIGSMTTPL
jgi:UDP-N-acetyl-D-mannosaminuronate dehydrogenase